MAWKPPSTWMTVAGRRREPVRQQRERAARDGLDVGVVPAQRRAAVPRVLEQVEPGDALGRHRAHRPGRDQVDPDVLRPELAGEVARRSTPGRPSPRPSSRRPARPRAASKSRPSERAAGLGPNSGSVAMASDFSEYADTCTAVATSSHGASRNPPPRQDAGAKPIACTTPSMPSTCSRTRSASDVEVLLVRDVQLEHRRRRRQPLAPPARRATCRPKPVSTTVAPSSCASRAIENAMDASVMTPVTAAACRRAVPYSLRTPSPMPPSTGSTAPGHVRGRVGGEVQRRAGDLVHAAVSLHRHAGEHLRPPRLGHRRRSCRSR